jgi:sporulation protein YlmC with PRC-barrel domain
MIQRLPFSALATAVTIALVNPLYAQDSQDTEIQNEQAVQQGQVPTRIQIMAADDILDEDVNDSQGEELGEIEYLMIDLENGTVRYAIIETEDDEGLLMEEESLSGIPWSALKFDQSGDEGYILDMTREEFQQAPKVTEEGISELTKPLVLSQIYDYYMKPTDASGDPTEQPDASEGASDQAGQADEQQQTAQPEQTAEGEVQSYMLVSRDIVTMVMPPELKTANQVVGTDVENILGETVGEIDQMVIDTDHGQVAYVLLARGGFLGIGEEWLPVPFGALNWSQDEKNFTLEVAEPELQKMESIPKEDLPTQVRVDHLKTLYERFQVTPYWQQMAQQQS